MIKKDEIKAYDYFLEASKKGNDYANYNLGKINEYVGRIDNAIGYYTEAVLNDEPYSMKRIVELWEGGYIDYVKKESIDEMKEAYEELF